MNVLCINTYGGSLLLGARAIGAHIVASLEDSGFGSDIQALNFPGVPRVEKIESWPESYPGHDWPEIDVIAHPPCAAFSGQNSSKSKRGTGTDAFKCHVNVINYALGHGCRSLAIESVLGAYEAASETYEELGMQYDYSVSYIMLNSASFGVPQWRPRFWVIFHRAKDPFRVEFRPQYVPLGSILDPVGTDWDFKGGPGRVWQEIKPLVRPEWPSGTLPAVLEKVYDIPREPNFKGARDKFNIRGFTTSHVRFVTPDIFASVVLYDQVLAIGNRLLTVEEYCEVMGFPRDYRWGRRLKDFRMYLSKGVCPPVASWILKTMDLNSRGWEGPFTHEEMDYGGVIDLRPKKEEALKAANQAGLPLRPPLVFIDCPVCSEANGAKIRHNGTPCGPGKPAFDPKSSEEYKSALKFFRETERKP
jgi:site-specific DNA-cytosine methylase